MSPGGFVQNEAKIFFDNYLSKLFYVFVKVKGWDGMERVARWFCPILGE